MKRQLSDFGLISGRFCGYIAAELETNTNQACHKGQPGIGDLAISPERIMDPCLIPGQVVTGGAHMAGFVKLAICSV